MRVSELREILEQQAPRGKRQTSLDESKVSELRDAVSRGTPRKVNTAIDEVVELETGVVVRRWMISWGQALGLSPADAARFAQVDGLKP